MRLALSPLLLSLLFVSAAACKDEEAKDDKSDKKAEKPDDSRAVATPTLCDHVKGLGYGSLRDEQGCIMRLDGLQIQLGRDDWKTHGKCIADAGSTDAVEACLKTADEASLAKAKAAGG
jgi:hypothetical protein